tara:strand:+ start:738 stop:911 length:174 start_codon:yes stop_codon:yes gene_type:complete
LFDQESALIYSQHFPSFESEALGVFWGETQSENTGGYEELEYLEIDGLTFFNGHYYF